MMLSSKVLFSQTSALLLFSVFATFSAYAGGDGDLAPQVPDSETISEIRQQYALEKTLELNFSPDDRARLRKALADFSRNTDPEHIAIQKRRKAMKANLKQRFARCDNDVDETLTREEAAVCLPQVARHFSYVDVDEDNVITFEELELAQAKWSERHKAANARVEAERLEKLEAELKQKGKLKIKKQASSIRKQPS